MSGHLACLVVVAACGRGGKPESAPGSATPPVTPADATVTQTVVGDAQVGCTDLPFADTTPVPEASGAAWMTIDGKLALVVISDSGNKGAYGIVDPETGATRETGKLPLGGEGEDLEGVAERDGKLYAITSPGWIRSWKRVAGGFELVDAPYPLGPIDLTGKANAVGDRPPVGNGMVCDAKITNCGRNYEGLCLAPSPNASKSHCIGFAAAKADGNLYCLAEQGGKLVVEREGSIHIARPGALADCAFSERGALYAGSNLFDFGAVYQVTGWEDPKSAQVRSLGPLVAGFPETLAVRGDVIYRMSDLGEPTPSSMKKFRCSAP